MPERLLLILRAYWAQELLNEAAARRGSCLAVEFRV
jgi:hypothetical protein